MHNLDKSGTLRTNADLKTKELPGKSGLQKQRLRFKAEWKWLFQKDLEYENLDILLMERQKNKKNTLKECKF